MEPISWNSLKYSSPTAVAIGNFDGVHLGHQKIINDLLKLSGERSLIPVFVTFSPHPDHFLKKDAALPILTTSVEKQLFMTHFGAQNIHVLNFEKSLAGLSRDDFIKIFLIKNLNCKCVFLGPGHRFGKGGQGNTQYLKDTKIPSAPEVMVIEPYEVEGEILSSTMIRKALVVGDMDKSIKLMGHPFSYTGKVVSGEGRGKKLGFPTANLDLNSIHKLRLPNGVYGGFCTIKGENRPVIVNIGQSPTFGGNKFKIEAHILDFDQDIYDKTLTIELDCYIRKEIEFKNAHQLMEQIEVDINHYTKKLERKATHS